MYVCMYIYIGRYSICNDNDSARYTAFALLFLISKKESQPKTYLRYGTIRYDTISSVLVEKCQKNPGITLRDVRG